MYVYLMFKDGIVQTTFFLEASTNQLTEAFILIYIVGLKILHIVPAAFFCWKLKL